MKKIVKSVLILSITIIISWLCSYSFAQNNYDKFSIAIYYYPRPVGNHKNFVLVYENEKPEFSKKIASNLVSAKKVWFPKKEKDYIFDGFFKIYVRNKDKTLEYEVNNAEYVYDVEKNIYLKYNVAFDIYMYLGSLYLKDMIDQDLTE